MIPRRWLPPLLWAATILVLTSVPVPDVGAPANSDKVVHYLVYGLLGMFVGRALLLEGRRVRHLALAALAVSAFGALDEWHQSFIHGRMGDVHDWIADSIGGASALAFMSLRARRASLS